MILPTPSFPGGLSSRPKSSSFYIFLAGNSPAAQDPILPTPSFPDVLPGHPKFNPSYTFFLLGTLRSDRIQFFLPLLFLGIPRPARIRCFLHLLFLGTIRPAGNLFFLYLFFLGTLRPARIQLFLHTVLTRIQQSFDPDQLNRSKAWVHPI